MHAIILGIGSDIGREIAARLCLDRWEVTGYHHRDLIKLEPWDLIVCCYGTLEPIGSFWKQAPDEWERAFHANLFLPLRQIRALYPRARPGASVCLFSGAGTGGSAPTYSAYATSKVALIKAVELMDDESPDCKFFILGPGIVRTTIHNQTMRAGARAANFGRVQDFLLSGAPGTSHDDIYACLMACHAAPKAAIGGRNIHVLLDGWNHIGVLKLLEAYPELLKLRRQEHEALRRGD